MESFSLDPLVLIVFFNQKNRGFVSTRKKLITVAKNARGNPAHVEVGTLDLELL